MHKAKEATYLKKTVWLVANVVYAVNDYFGRYLNLDNINITKPTSARPFVAQP